MSLENSDIEYILGLDPATVTGYAYGKDGDNLSLGIIDLHSTNKEDNRYALYGRFYNYLDALNINKPSLVVVESSAMLRLVNKRAIEIQIGLLGVIRCWCFRNEHKYLEISPQQLKIHATGKGNAKKELMMEKAKPLYMGSDHNVADAVHLWTYGCLMKDKLQGGTEIITVSNVKKKARTMANTKRLKKLELDLYSNECKNS